MARAAIRADSTRTGEEQIEERISAARVTGPLCSVVGVWTTAIAAAAVIQPRRIVHTGAVGAHLAYLFLGFGLVLVVDATAVVFLLRRCSLLRLLATIDTASPVIWGCWGGLLATGALLGPRLDSTLTQVKLAAVLLMGVNGLAAARARDRFTRGCHRQSPRHGVSARIRHRAVTTGLVSQAAWWTAILIGWHNRTW